MFVEPMTGEAVSRCANFMVLEYIIKCYFIQEKAIPGQYLIIFRNAEDGHRKCSVGLRVLIRLNRLLNES